MSYARTPSPPFVGWIVKLFHHRILEDFKALAVAVDPSLDTEGQYEHEPVCHLIKFLPGDLGISCGLSCEPSIACRMYRSSHDARETHSLRELESPSGWALRSRCNAADRARMAVIVARTPRR